MLRVWRQSSAESESGNVPIPVASAMSTRKATRCDKKTGNTRSGLDAIFNSSRFLQEASAGGKATRKLAEISSARSELQICGSVFVRKAGMKLGVLEEPTRR